MRNLHQTLNSIAITILGVAFLFHLLTPQPNYLVFTEHKQICESRGEGEYEQRDCFDIELLNKHLERMQVQIMNLYQLTPHTEEKE